MNKRVATAICLAVGELAAGACLIFGIMYAPDRQDLMITGVVLQLAIACCWVLSSLKPRSGVNPSDAD